jgi:hypothetical protein
MDEQGSDESSPDEDSPEVDILAGDIRVFELESYPETPSGLSAGFWSPPLSEFGDSIVRTERDCWLLARRPPEGQVSAGVVTFSGLESDAWLEPWCDEAGCAYGFQGTLPEDGNLFADDAVIGAEAAGDALEGFALQVRAPASGLELEDLRTEVTGEGDWILSWEPDPDGAGCMVEYRVMLYCHLGCTLDSILCRSPDDGELVVPAGILSGIFLDHQIGGWWVMRYTEERLETSGGTMRLRVERSSRQILMFP